MPSPMAARRSRTDVAVFLVPVESPPNRNQRELNHATSVWHDWWNASDHDARVRVEITPGERFVHLIESFFGLARLGHTDSKGMPYPLQLALSAREFKDVIVFRSPPLALQGFIFATLAPIAHWRGYRATYPQLSRIVLAPRT